MIQEFAVGLKPKVEKTSVIQLLDLLKAFGLKGLNDVDDVRAEALSLLPSKQNEVMHQFVVTGNKIIRSLFNHGCDYLMMEFDKEFERERG